MPHRESIATFTDPLFRALFDQTTEAVLLTGFPDGPIMVANRHAAEVLGKDLTAFEGNTLLELCTRESRAMLEGVIETIRDAGGMDTFSGHMEREDGSSFPCEINLQGIEQDGRHFMLVTFKDISERVRAAEDIELRNIAIANVTSGVTVADARKADLPLIYVNRGFQEITGYSAREAVGRSCRFLQGEDRDQPGLDTLRGALRKGEACTVRLRNYRKDGTLFHNELHISPVHSERGELTHFVGIQLDVTEQVKARESLERSELRYRQALEQEKELNDIKSRFISMVSHEFRTPMTGIQASAALLRRTGDRLDAEKRHRHLLNIESSLKRMNRLLDDVLFFSRADSEKLRVRIKAVKFATYLAKLMDGLHLIYPGRTIDCDNGLPPDATLMLDEHLLDHILQNLISNAVKYSAEASAVKCRVSQTPETIEFSIHDEGIGIPEADQEKLFEAFHRAGNVGTRAGTGLGLNIVLRAVELLGGNITFTSKENTGSTFTVSLPKIQSDRKSDHDQDSNT
jgi:PAS domain S-box-containing protein